MIPHNTLVMWIKDVEEHLPYYPQVYLQAQYINPNTLEHTPLDNLYPQQAHHGQLAMVQLGQVAMAWVHLVVSPTAWAWATRSRTGTRLGQ